MEFSFHSVMNSLKYPKSKSLSHCLTELFPIYQNKPLDHLMAGRLFRQPIVPPYYIQDSQISTYTVSWFLLNPAGKKSNEPKLKSIAKISLSNIYTVLEMKNHSMAAAWWCDFFTPPARYESRVSSLSKRNIFAFPILLMLEIYKKNFVLHWDLKWTFLGGSFRTKTIINAKVLKSYYLHLICTS